MDHIQILFEKINSGRTVFLTGAGSSFNSGIPIVSHIYTALLEILEFDAAEVELFWKSQFPFESFMASIKEVVPEYFSIMLEIFKAKHASSNHQFIANCLAEGFVSTVFTTNFDDLLQRALDQNKIDYTTYYTQKSLKRFSIQDHNQIVHLHGFIHSKRTIASTIDRVAGLWGIEARKSAMHQLLSNDDHDTIMSIGYSYSDIFDIVPLIESDHHRSKQFIMLDYLDAGTEVVSASDTEYPFSQHPDSMIIRTNIDELVIKVNHLLFGHSIDSNKYTTPWKDLLFQLFGDFDKADLFAIKGKVLGLMDRPISSLTYFKQAYHQSDARKKEFYQSIYINQLNEVGQFELAFQLAKEQLIEFNDFRFQSDRLKGKSEIEIRLRIAVAALNLGYLDEANEHLILAKNQIEALRLFAYMPECYFYLIDLFIAQGKFGDADDIMKEAIGNCAVHTPQSLPSMFGKLADVCYVQGRTNEALSHARQSWELAKNHGDVSDINSALCRLTSLYMSVDDLKNSLLFSTELESTTRQLINPIDRAFSHSILGKHYGYLLESFPDAKREMLYEESIRHFSLCIKIFDDHGMDVEQILALSELSRTHAIFGNREKCLEIEHIIEPELDHLQDRHSRLEVYDCLSDVFQRLEMRQKSLLWLNKLIGEIRNDVEYQDYFELLNIEGRLRYLNHG